MAFLQGALPTGRGASRLLVLLCALLLGALLAPTARVAAQADMLTRVPVAPLISGDGLPPRTLSQTTAQGRGPLHAALSEAERPSGDWIGSSLPADRFTAEQYILANEPSMARLAVPGVRALPDPRTLVLLQTADLAETHSQFLAMLQDIGLQTSVAFGDSSVPFLSHDGLPAFGNLIFVGTDFAGLPSFYNHKNLIKFMERGGNVLAFFGPTEEPSFLHAFGYQIGFEFRGKATNFRALDYATPERPLEEGDFPFSFRVDQVSDTYRKLFGTRSAGPTLYSGTAFTSMTSSPAFNLDSLQVVSFLRGNPTTFVADVTNYDVPPTLPVMGRSLDLVAGMQTRKNTRALLAGSTSMISNHALEAGNRAFARNVLRWGVNRAGLLRVVSTTHHLADSAAGPAGPRPSEYTIWDRITFRAEIQQLADDGRTWIPATGIAPFVEVKMLEPFLRAALEPTTDGHFTATFSLPNAYGVFTFSLSLMSPGLSFINVPEVVAIRPLRYSQYERFLPSGHFSYAAIWVMAAATVLVTLFFLLHPASVGQVQEAKQVDDGARPSAKRKAH
ncbi:hypothetical protein H696_04504 [Fonticula alba]|uniref:Dolichyl-diphosphooligosaccharide--protein glycosyltransferase 48 kDa subunit n=1 Tax=Fonticula alba TaxID=691883 RepID=A0A058Z483_FONAL|nr:hypothetical protein H696_04504 [Fonticula alba]KCV69089.1 hypothetical protein H696_04504 [Fonticula alba]|eukprot:XP_009496660.1 hypothetical protein H696_04504 [Fonticula alba]